MAGRPSKYDEKTCCQIARLACQAGMIDTEIADELEIDIATLYRWKLKHPEFCESLKENKEVIDEKVKNKLYTRAMGYYYNEVHTEEIQVKGENGEGEPIKIPAVKIKTITKHVVPDVTAQIFWLKNRQPETWRDTKEVNFEDRTFAEWVKKVNVEEKEDENKI